MKSIYLISGEHSGDSHGADFVEEWLRLVPGGQVHGLGGPKMRALAPAVRDWVDDAAVVGLIEVLKHYGWFKEQFAQAKSDIERLKPDAVIFIDYPGFNLRMAKALRDSGFAGKLIYYISPQVWAWNQGRIPQMAQHLDLMLCLFPFEVELFQKAGLETQFVGHPIVDDLVKERAEVPRNPQLIGLFPGSREREIERLFPLMAETAQFLLKTHPTWRFCVPAASERFVGRLNEMRDEAGLTPEQCQVQLGGSKKLMQEAWCGVVASGTATLEAAYFGLPYTLVYKVAWPTYFIGKMLIRVKYLGIINILANESVVQELVQADAEPCALSREIEHLMVDQEYHQKLQKKLQQTVEQLGEPGSSRRAALAVVKTMGA